MCFLSVIYIGKLGHSVLFRTPSGLIEEHSIQVCVDNAGNAVSRFSLTPQVADDHVRPWISRSYIGRSHF